MISEIRTDVNENAEQSLGHDLQQSALGRTFQALHLSSEQSGL